MFGVGAWICTIDGIAYVAAETCIQLPIIVGNIVTWYCILRSIG